ncbi:hypothetical protein [Calidifontibacter indicus]|uniref:hypothetical protein n=1 Tax=Calidifontibacter indicus TaxID=419650 RepID=UPI003D714DD6
MTLTTQDLRDAMDAYVDEVRVPNSEAMLAGVRDRVRADRRRGRTRLVAAVAAGVLAVGAAVGVNHVWPEQTLTPAEQVKKAGAHLPLFVGGYKLVGVQEVTTHYGDPQLNLPQQAPPPASSLTDLGTFSASSQTQAMVACADLLTTGTAVEDTGALMSRDGEATTCYTEATSDPLIPNTPTLSAFDGRPFQVTVASVNPAVRKSVPVGLYVPAKWGDYPAPTATEAVQLDPPSQGTVDPGVVDKSVRGATGRATTLTVSPEVSDDTDVLVTVQSGSAGQFRARVDGVAATPRNKAAATDGWAPVWIPNGAASFVTTVHAKAGSPITVVVDAKDTRGDWVVGVSLVPRSVTSMSSSTLP